MDKGPHLNLVTSLKAVFPSSLLMYLGKALQDGPRAWTPVLGSWPWPWSSSGCCECLGKLANQGPLSLPLSLTLPFKYINKSYAHPKISTLNVNGLNTPTNIQRLLRAQKKK